MSANAVHSERDLASGNTDFSDHERATRARVGALIREGLTLSRIAEIVGEQLSQHAPEVIAVEPSSEALRSGHYCDYRAVASPPLLRNPSLTKLRRIPVESLQLYTLDDFMSAAECSALCELIEPHLQPSMIAGRTSDKYFRTSRSCDLFRIQHPLVWEIDTRIAHTMGIQLAYSERIQVQHYGVGQQFKHHTDYFVPGTEDYMQHAGVEGNRTWTFMVYLNDCEAGGGTNFPAVNVTFQPKRGQAVIWNNLDADGVPNPHSMHAGEPVLAGHKVIITKWFRERGKGEMFYS